MIDYSERRRKKGVIGCLFSLSGIILIGLLCLVSLLCSCASQKEYIPVEQHHAEIVAKIDTFIQKDSIFLHDSVYIHQKGDTVWIEKWYTKYVDRWHERVRIDSFIKTDSVPVPYPIERKLTHWEQVKIDYGGEAIVVLTIVFFIMIWLVICRLRR